MMHRKAGATVAGVRTQGPCATHHHASMNPASPLPATRPAALPVAVWRLLCLGGLIVQGVHTVRWRFPALAPDARHDEVQRWARRVLRVLRVDVVQAGQLGPGTRMLVSNHVSWLDVMVLHALLPQARFVAKSEVRDWPAVGTLVAGAGSLFVDRRQPRLARRSVDEVTGVLRSGGLVAVFAEGTTTDGRQVLPFRSGLLRAATAAGCPVQPLALRYREGALASSRSVPYIDDDSLLQSLWRLCRSGGIQARVTLLAPRPAGASTPRDLATHLHRDVSSALGLQAGAARAVPGATHRA